MGLTSSSRRTIRITTTSLRRWTGEIGDFAVRAAVGYQWLDNPDGKDTSRLAGSATIVHTPTGLNFALSAGQQIDGASYVWGRAGWRNDVFDVGATSLSVDYYNGRDFLSDGAKTENYGVYAVQTFDAASIDIYGGLRKFTYERRWAHLSGRLWHPDRCALLLLNAGLVVSPSALPPAPRSCSRYIFVEFHVFLHGVHFALARTDGDGGDAVLVQPIGIKPAGREHQVGLETQRLERLGRAAHHRCVFSEVEWRIGLYVGEGHLRHCAVRCLYGLPGLLKGLAKACAISVAKVVSGLLASPRIQA